MGKLSYLAKLNEDAQWFVSEIAGLERERAQLSEQEADCATLLAEKLYLEAMREEHLAGAWLPDDVPLPVCCPRTPAPKPPRADIALTYTSAMRQLDRLSARHAQLLEEHEVVVARQASFARDQAYLREAVRQLRCQLLLSESPIVQDGRHHSFPLCKVENLRDIVSHRFAAVRARCSQLSSYRPVSLPKVPPQWESPELTDDEDAPFFDREPLTPSTDDCQTNKLDGRITGIKFPNKP